MNPKDPILSQYLAALEMLKQAVNKCPSSLWNDLSDKNKFWHIAYHALFYTHLYLQVSEQEFKPWPQHREQYEFMGPLPWTPHDQPKIGKPYTKDEILSYLDFCQKAVQEKVAILDLNADNSGFSWLPFSKLELQIYNIRHLQHHTAELMERLGERENINLDWIGRK